MLYDILVKYLKSNAPHLAIIKGYQCDELVQEGKAVPMSPI